MERGSETLRVGGGVSGAETAKVDNWVLNEREGTCQRRDEGGMIQVESEYGKSKVPSRSLDTSRRLELPSCQDTAVE